MAVRKSKGKSSDGAKKKVAMKGKVRKSCSKKPSKKKPAKKVKTTAKKVKKIAKKATKKTLKKAVLKTTKGVLKKKSSGNAAKKKVVEGKASGAVRKVALKVSSRAGKKIVRRAGEFGKVQKKAASLSGKKGSVKPKGSHGVHAARKAEKKHLKAFDKTKTPVVKKPVLTSKDADIDERLPNEDLEITEAEENIYADTEPEKIVPEIFDYSQYSDYPEYYDSNAVKEFLEEDEGSDDLPVVNDSQEHSDIDGHEGDAFEDDPDNFSRGGQSKDDDNDNDDGYF